MEVLDFRFSKILFSIIKRAAIYKEREVNEFEILNNFLIKTRHRHIVTGPIDDIIGVGTAKAQIGRESNCYRQCEAIPLSNPRQLRVPFNRLTIYPNR